MYKQLRGETLGGLVSGAVGALAPMYCLSLFTTRDFSDALLCDLMLTVGRGVLVGLGNLPGAKRVPVIRDTNKLFYPEYYGFIAGFILYRGVQRKIQEGRESNNGMEERLDVNMTTE